MKKKWLFPILGLASVLAIPALTGCSGASIAQSAIPQIQLRQQQEGIWVNGTGEVTVTPDIAIVRLGIVAQEASVADAQSRASEAMSKVMKALTDSGIAQKDVQTGAFNINQRTRWDDRQQTEVVIGYQVSHMVTVKIRETGKAGTIIDSVAQAGGDLTRINGISFSVEDPSTYYQQAREKAVKDANNRAEQLARLAGVTLGKPVFITESVQSSGISDSFRSAMAIPAPMPIGVTPPISPGETKIILNVQVAYGISQ